MFGGKIPSEFTGYNVKCCWSKNFRSKRQPPTPSQLTCFRTSSVFDTVTLSSITNCSNFFLCILSPYSEISSQLGIYVIVLDLGVKVLVTPKNFFYLINLADGFLWQQLLAMWCKTSCHYNWCVFILPTSWSLIGIKIAIGISCQSNSFIHWARALTVLWLDFAFSYSWASRLLQIILLC